MSDITTNVTDVTEPKINPVTEVKNFTLSITNSAFRVEIDVKDSYGRVTGKEWVDLKDENGRTVYGVNFRMITDDPNFVFPKMVEMDEMKAILSEKMAQDMPFQYADGKTEVNGNTYDKALCYVAKSEKKDLKPVDTYDENGMPTKTPKRWVVNYRPLFPRKQVPGSKLTFRN